MMHNTVLRDQGYMNRLKDAIWKQYGITAIDITPAKRGYYGETWKVRGNAGCYFFKLTKPGLIIPTASFSDDAIESWIILRTAGLKAESSLLLVYKILNCNCP